SSQLHFSSLFHHTAPTALHSLSLHDALPISPIGAAFEQLLGIGGQLARERRHFGLSVEDLAIGAFARRGGAEQGRQLVAATRHRSEEHTSELQSRENLVCRLLLEKKK